MRKLSFDELKSTRPDYDEVARLKRFPIRVVCENIRSLYNVGSIFRTSDGALIEKIFLCGYTGFPPRREIEKTALGSTLSVPWEYLEDAREAVDLCRRSGYQVVCLEHTDAGMDYTRARYRFPVCLVLGNEVEGVSPELVALCDMAVEIPMYGIKQSLNVSVAYGIMVYHLLSAMPG